MGIASKSINQGTNVLDMIRFFPKLGVDTVSGCLSPLLMFICLSPSRAPRTLIAPLS